MPCKIDLLAEIDEGILLQYIDYFSKQQLARVIYLFPAADFLILAGQMLAEKRQRDGPLP